MGIRRGRGGVVGLRSDAMGKIENCLADCRGWRLARVWWSGGATVSGGLG